jgi:hypothetical protein
MPGIRVREGVECDLYRCPDGHQFLVEFARSPSPLETVPAGIATKPAAKRGAER